MNCLTVKMTVARKQACGSDKTQKGCRISSILTIILHSGKYGEVPPKSKGAVHVYGLQDQALHPLETVQPQHCLHVSAVGFSS